LSVTLVFEFNVGKSWWASSYPNTLDFAIISKLVFEVVLFWRIIAESTAVDLAFQIFTATIAITAGHVFFLFSELSLCKFDLRL